MLDRFPPEILLEILSWTRHYPSPRYDSSPKHTLCVCARVSKKMNAAAEALVWRKVEIKTDEALKQVVAGSKDKTRDSGTRELVISLWQKPLWERDTEGMNTVIRLFQNHTTVTINGRWELSKHETAALSALSGEVEYPRPGTRRTKFESISNLSTLPSLSTLSLTHKCILEEKDVPQLLSADKMPNLKFLRLGTLRQPGGSDYFPDISSDYFPVLSPASLSRIDRLRLSSSDFTRSTSSITLPLPSDKTLFVLNHRKRDGSVIARLPAVNLALTSVPVAVGGYMWDGRETDPVAILQQPLPLLHASTKLKSIGIQTYIRDRSVAQSSSVAAAYSALLRAAEAHGVAVWWYEQDAFKAFGTYLRGTGGAASGAGGQ